MSSQLCIVDGLASEAGAALNRRRGEVMRADGGRLCVRFDRRNDRWLGSGVTRSWLRARGRLSSSSIVTFTGTVGGRLGGAGRFGWGAFPYVDSGLGGRFIARRRRVFRNCCLLFGIIADGLGLPCGFQAYG